MSRSNVLISIGSVIGLNALILAPLPLQVRAVAAFLLAVPATGILALNALRLQREISRAERLLFAVGTGYAATILTMMLLAYLPGGLQRWQTLVAFDFLAIGLIAVSVLGARSKARAVTDVVPLPDTDNSNKAGGVWLWLAIASILVTASFLRVPGLSYSEFQDDEVSVVWHSAELIQGREDALFIHDKGPAEILVTTAVYSLAVRLNESSARLPFTVANITALLAIFWLGWRFFGPVAGWAAAMLLALDGYFIGFARIVQYQSIVFLMVVLTAGILYRYVERPRSSPALLYLAGLFFASGVLAHYEAALVIIPGLYLAVKSIQKQGSTLRSATHLVLAALLSLGTLLLFYVPFSLHPRFTRTFTEITANRIGTGFPYNNLEDFFTRSIIYNSTYYFAFMAAGVVVALIVVYRRTLPAWLTWLAGAAVIALLISFFVRPTWLSFGGADYAWMAFALALAPPLLSRRVSIAERATWLWFAAGLILALFFVQKPRTHVYDFLIPMSLVVGSVIALGWDTLERRMGRRAALAVGISAASVLTLVFANYGYWLFVHNRVEVLRTWEENRPAGYWTPMEEARQNAIFGFPFKNGWKVVGVLYADGTLDAPFARNGKRGVSNWYTRGTWECSRDAQYFVFTPWNEPTNRGLLDPPRRPTPEDGYELIHTVTVNGEPRLEIFERGAAPVAAPQVHDVSDYENRFDSELSGPVFEMPGVAGFTNIEHPLDFRFGEDIWLRGYTLRNKEPRTGERVDLTLYWEADRTPGRSYKVFTQVIDPETFHKAGQRDGVPACERNPTDRWLPADTIVDRYSIVIEDGAPAGDYALLIGMYDDEGERLDIFTVDGGPAGDSLGIDTINVVD